jgi:hypothetical protein
MLFERKIAGNLGHFAFKNCKNFWEFSLLSVPSMSAATIQDGSLHVFTFREKSASYLDEISFISG